MPKKTSAEEIRAPGLAAMVRRSPHRVRQGAAAAIGAGIVLFVVTSVASAATGKPAPAAAAPAAPAPLTSAAVSAPGTAPTPAAPAAARPARVAPKQRTTQVRHPHRQAPASNQVISGLAANGIPTVALNAYRVAAARMAHVLPSCGIDWAMLAGIGREESDHGRFGGAVLTADGTSTPRIIGPALDGANSDLIAAPAGSAAITGDAAYTHALGPMQFIPQTWAGYGADANGDGKADIFNINDAALGAARYLCAAGGDLRTQAGRVRAVHAYNHNDTYVAQVLALAQAYRTGVPVSGIPVGILTGALPRITAGSGPGVNPGAPTAIGKVAGSHKVITKSGSTASNGSSPAKSGTHQPKPSKSSAPPSRAAGSGTKSSAPKSGSGSSSSAPAGGSGAHGGSGGSSGGGSGGSPTPTPTPSPSCKAGIGGTCLIP